ncbi:hypothetical protein B0H66DRAFT_570238 [Apodospora peruviana]|uniref:GED domain-containing protein n=1 Tax=Apodospora peruviana TaxID=516989 RepID=A0AAE0HSR9_9PEZI|nr:hypothetical protein B0H66DRAFT_570238 [Apodospora peruviana]
MDSDQVTRVAGESEDSRTLREQLTRQLDVLGKGLEICKRFAGLRVSGDSIFVSSATVFNDLPDSDNHESDTIELTSRLREANRVATSKSVVPTPESPHLSDVVPEVEVVLEEPEPMPVPEAAIEFETKAVGMTDDDFCSGIPTKRSKKKLQKQSIWSPDQ